MELLIAHAHRHICIAADHSKTCMLNIKFNKKLLCISGTDHSPEPRKLENTENEVVLLRWLVERVAAVAPSEVGGIDL